MRQDPGYLSQPALPHGGHRGTQAERDQQVETPRQQIGRMRSAHSPRGCGPVQSIPPIPSEGSSRRPHRVSWAPPVKKGPEIPGHRHEIPGRDEHRDIVGVDPRGFMHGDVTWAGSLLCRGTIETLTPGNVSTTVVAQCFVPFVAGWEPLVRRGVVDFSWTSRPSRVVDKHPFVGQVRIMIGAISERTKLQGKAVLIIGPRSPCAGVVLRGNAWPPV